MEDPVSELMISVTSVMWSSECIYDDGVGGGVGNVVVRSLSDQGMVAVDGGCDILDAILDDILDAILDDILDAILDDILDNILDDILDNIVLRGNDGCV